MITNKINNKKYIGKTLKTIEERWKEHKRAYKRKSYENRPLYRAMNKYGIENFCIEEIANCSNEEINEKEQYFIKFYNTYHFGYNATLGGDGKQYLDHSLIIKTFNQNGLLKQTAQELGIHEDTVCEVLKANNILKPSRKETAEKLYGVPVVMLSMDNETIKTFSTFTNAAMYIVEIQNRKKEDYIGIIPHIVHVCKGARKSAYGYKWEYATPEKEDTSNV